MTEGHAYWRRHARRYDRFSRILNPRIDAVAQRVAAAVRGSDRTLEIAAGTGLVTIALARNPGKLLVTDQSPAMLEVLRDRLSGAGPVEVEIATADATALQHPDASFDAVVMANLLHLLPEPTTVLAEIRRVLTPVGLLAAPTYCHGETITAHVVSRLLGASGIPVTRRFRGGELRALVESGGFQVLEEELVGGLLPIRFILARPSAAAETEDEG